MRKRRRGRWRKEAASSCTPLLVVFPCMIAILVNKTASILGKIPSWLVSPGEKEEAVSHSDHRGAAED